MKFLYLPLLNKILLVNMVSTSSHFIHCQNRRIFSHKCLEVFAGFIHLNSKKIIFQWPNMWGGGGGYNAKIQHGSCIKVWDRKQPLTHPYPPWDLLIVLEPIRHYSISNLHPFLSLYSYKLVTVPLAFRFFENYSKKWGYLFFLEFQNSLKPPQDLYVYTLRSTTL